jgi:hypothetical protein
VTYSAIISITFSDYWLSSTGGSGKGDLDMICARDRDGCPVLPMTQVKGMLRETAERLYPEGEVTRLFGGRTKDGDVSPPQEGQLRFSGFARLPDADRAWFGQQENKDNRAALFARLRSTKITKTGIAETNSLRTAEVAIPLTLNGRIDWVGTDDPPQALIEAICMLTFSFGHGKNDGLGRAIATCSEFCRSITPELTSTNQRLVIDLTPDDLAVFSRGNANQGEQLTHAGPTGASLWGWAISQLNGDADALKLLLSGKISFSDAVPLIDTATPAFMRPSILFAPKQPRVDAEKPFKKKTFDLAELRIGMEDYIASYGKDRQAKALKPNHISLALDCIASVSTGHRLRSAHKEGKAEDAKLFGYRHINQQATGYRAVIETKENVGHVWSKIVAAFSNRLILGKARNNGYGGSYTVAMATDDSFVPESSRTIEAGANMARIWCLTDIALYDQWGRLTIEPSREDFNLPEGWLLSRTESAVTTRRYAPWDSAIQGHEREITVIEAGSVFSFLGPALVDAIALPERVGHFAERGCGWIAIVPTKMPDKLREPQKPSMTNDTGIGTVSFTALSNWAEERSKIRDTRAMDAWVAEAKSKIEQIRKGPTKTQWSMVKLDGVEQALDGKDWEDVYVDRHSLKDWLKAQHSVQERWPAPHKAAALKRLVDHAKRKVPSRGRDES